MSMHECIIVNNIHIHVCVCIIPFLYMYSDMLYCSYIYTCANVLYFHIGRCRYLIYSELKVNYTCVII